MRRRIPGVVRRPVMAVPAGAAERELDHVGFAGNAPELTAQRRDEWSVLLPRVGRQAAARSGEAGKSGGGEEVLDRDRHALQRPGRCPGGECRVGRGGDGTRLIRRPERVGVQPFPEALVPGNSGFDQFPSADPAFA